MTAATENTKLVPPASTSPAVGSLIAMLKHSRSTTLSAVEGMTVRELDQQFDEKSNPIGSLLAHIAAVEWFYLVKTLEEREPRGDECATWGRCSA